MLEILYILLEPPLKAHKKGVTLKDAAYVCPRRRPACIRSIVRSVELGNGGGSAAGGLSALIVALLRAPSMASYRLYGPPVGKGSNGQCKNKDVCVHAFTYVYIYICIYSYICVYMYICRCTC